MNVDQTQFTKALLNPEIRVPEGLIDHQGRPAGKRFDVYRNNVVMSLMEAMQTAFPVIHKLVGDAFFRAMAGVYVREYPPKTPMLMFYGGAFPAFLETFEPAQNLPYLPDVARLELARRSSYHAADADALDPNTLGTLAPDTLMSAKLTLAPSLRLMASSYPILDIWTMNMVEGAPKPEMKAQTVLLTRPALDVDMVEIDTAQYTFILNLKTMPLGDAFEATLEKDGTFDLTQALSLLMAHQLIINIET